MAWLRRLKSLHSDCATDCDFKILRVLQKLKQLIFEKKFSSIVSIQVIITNEVPVTILQACMSLLRHIRKWVLLRQNIASHLFSAVGCQQFRKDLRKHQRRIVFESNYFFVHHCLLSYCCIMFQKQYFEKPKMGHKQPLRGHGTPGPA